MPVSVTYKGEEIENPFLRALVVTIGIIAAGIGALSAGLGMLLLAVAFIVMVVTSPVWLLIDLLLKQTGRRGFVQQGPPELKICFNGTSFKKV